MQISHRHARGVALVAAGGTLVVLALVALPRGAPSPAPRGPIVTLSSVAARFNTTLSTTLLSLVGQSLPPSAIRVFLPHSSAETFDALTSTGTLPAIFRHPLIHVEFVRDRGPATKLLPALEQLVGRARSGDIAALDERLVVVDDDHAYSPELLKTLVVRFERLKLERAECVEVGCVVGFRGWRLRRDLEWGVAPKDLWRHVVVGTKIRREYRVGVMTANEVILTRSPRSPPCGRAMLTRSVFVGLPRRPTLLPTPTNSSSSTGDPSSQPVLERTHCRTSCRRHLDLAPPLRRTRATLRHPPPTGITFTRFDQYSPSKPPT